MKRKLLTVLLALVAALCLCFGLAACGDNGGNVGDSGNSGTEQGGGSGQEEGGGNADTHEHTYTAENKCSVCGEEWEYTKSDALEYTRVVLDGVEGYDVRFGEWKEIYAVMDPDTGRLIGSQEKVIGKPYTDEEVVFPYGYNGLPVISIGRFYPCMSDTVKHITVPQSILSFGQSTMAERGTRGAFKCSALEVLDLPDGLPVLTRQEIPRDPYATSNTAFPLCLNTLFYGLGKVNPEDFPFYDDPQFRDENGALYIGNYLFDMNIDEYVETYIVKEGTKAVLSVRGAKHVVLPDSVEIIGNGAFRDIMLESVTCGSGLEEIGDSAFLQSGLTSITLPDKPIYIGSHVFDSTPLMNNDENWEYPNGRGNGESDAIPDRCLYIGNHLIAVTADYRGDGSVYTLKEGLKSIAGDAFNLYGDYSGRFNELRFPSVEAWLGVRRGGSGAVPSVQKLVVGGQETTEIDIPSSFTEVPDYAFCGLSSLTRVTLPAGVARIGNGAFQGCKNLTDITIPAGVTSIGNHAFWGCSGLTGELKIPDSVKTIGKYAFAECNGLDSVTIGSGVISIDSGAFRYCYGLTHVEISDSVKTIGKYAFSGMLTEIQYKGTVKAWQAIEKGYEWDYNTGDYTVTCTDGTVAKDGTVTYFE